MIHPVVMAGGSGSRLWPLSRQQFPKQFLQLEGDRSMLQVTLDRLSTLEFNDYTVICNEDHRFLIAEQLRDNASCESANANIILEPAGRNTAPAIALAALNLVQKDPDATLLVLAADHVIRDEMAFISAVELGQEMAQANKLVTFGILPSCAETGYGYIRTGKKVDDTKAHAVRAFKEKPDEHTAKSYVDSGDYLWNSGMFMFKASRYLEELQRFCPDMFNACHDAMVNGSRDSDFIRVEKNAFLSCPDNSIDYAVMERTQDAVVIPVDCGWSDVGSWSSLWEVLDKSAEGNVEKGDIINIDCSDSYLHSENKLIAAIGLKDIVVLDTKDATLVAHKSQVQKVKNIVAELKSAKRSQWLHHRTVQRSWGNYDAVDSGQRFKVKHVTVKPKETISQQLHYHRAEHWVVVSGTAKISRGNETIVLTENQSTYIPVGMIHSLHNPGDIPLEIIEVQSGTYLSEDDIFRFEEPQDKPDKTDQNQINLELDALVDSADASLPLADVSLVDRRRENRMDSSKPILAQ